MTGSLAKKAKRSVYWNTGFNLFRSALQFCIMLVLVRLLTPEAYGQFGMANSVIGLISVFAFQNFIAHTIQVRNDREVYYQDHFTAGAFIQTGLFLLTNTIALILRYFESYAPIVPLVHFLSLTFILECPCELRRKMLERELDWKRLRLLHAIGLLASSILAICMGLLNAGVYALIVPGLLVTIPFIYELFVIQGWRPTWQWNKKLFMPAFHFGINRMGSGLTAKLRPLAENALIIYFLGYAGIGLLGRAVGLSTMFCQQIALQLMYSIYPILTKVEPGTKRYRQMSSLIIRLVAWIALPTAMIFSTLAEPVITTVYGLKWIEVIPLLPWAMCMGALAALFHTTYMLLLAHHGQKFCFQIDALLIVVTLLILYFLLPFGLVVYMQGMVVIQTLAFVALLMALRRANGTSWSAIYQALLPPIVGISAAYLYCEFFFKLTQIDKNIFIAAVFYGVQFIAVYCLIIRLFFLNSLKELIKYLPGNKTINSVLLIREAT